MGGSKKAIKHQVATVSNGVSSSSGSISSSIGGGREKSKGTASLLDPFLLTHAFYLLLVSILCYLLVSKRWLSVLERFRPVIDRSSYDFEFKSRNPDKPNEQSFDLPPDLFTNPLMTVWKWKSPLAPAVCDSIWRQAEMLNDYGEYSKFGEEFPTLDVSLQKFPSRFDKFLQPLFNELAQFIAEKFLIKLPHDGEEMRYANGTLYFGKDIDYVEFLQLKGSPFVIKYDATGGKTAKLRTHKDNSDVSFIILVNKPDDFTDGGTYFHAIDKTLYMEQGEALVFNGQLVHEAIPISSGRRFVVSGFINFADEYKNMKRLGTMATTPMLY